MDYSPTPPPSPRPAHRDIPEREDTPSPDDTENIVVLPGWTRARERPRPYRGTSGSWGGTVPPHMRLNAVNNDLIERYQVREAEAISQLFNKGEYETCFGLCRAVLEAGCATEAILARTHMLLATPELSAFIEGSQEVAIKRIHHLEEAVKAWTTTVERRGTSRLDLDLARQQQRRAQVLLDIAVREYEEEWTTLLESACKAYDNTSSLTVPKESMGDALGEIGSATAPEESLSDASNQASHGTAPGETTNSTCWPGLNI